MASSSRSQYIIDRESCYYRFKDASGVWWWRCICSQTCWDHLQYRSLASLRRHQTARGRACCPVDLSFTPPVHELTVEFSHVSDQAPQKQSGCWQQEQVVIPAIDGPPGSPVYATLPLEEADPLEDIDLEDDAAPFDQGSADNRGTDVEEELDYAQEEPGDVTGQDVTLGDDAESIEDPEEDYDNHQLSEEDLRSSEEELESEDEGKLDGEPAGEDLEGFVHEALDDVLHQRMVQLLEKYAFSTHLQLEKERGGEEDLAGWAQAAHKRLTDACPQSQLVVDYCYDRLLSYRNNIKSRKVADDDLRKNAYRQFPALGPPDPAGFSNCWPPSLECCEAVLKKPDLDRYLMHCCPNGCAHWWTHMSEFRQHYKDCVGCELCRCPHCDGHRFVKDKHGLRGSARCWLFHDAFQQMLLDANLACNLLQGRAGRNNENVPGDDPMKPSFAKYKEGKRLGQELPLHGYSMKKVLYFGVAFDGVQLGKNYTVNMYVMRCRDAPPSIAVQSGTVVPLLIIPGPRDPEGGFDPYTSLILHLFHVYGPLSDTSYVSRQLLVPRRALVQAGLLPGYGEGGGEEVHHHANAGDNFIEAHIEQGGDAGMGGGLAQVQQAHVGPDPVSSEEFHNASQDAYMDAAEGVAGEVDGYAGLWSSDESAGHVTEMEEDEVGQGGDIADDDEDPLEPIDFQPVLTEWTCDWPGRCKLTSWAGHAAQFNGGWCMCNQKGKSEQGGVAIHGYTEAVEQPFLVDPFTMKPDPGEGQPKWWTAEGTARRAAALEKELAQRNQPAHVPEAGEEEHAELDRFPGLPHGFSDADVSGSEVDMDGDAVPKLRVYSLELLLGDEDLHAMADLAHSLKHAIITWQQNKQQKKQQNKYEFRRLGFKNVTEARAALTLLGRKGRSVWSSAYFKHNMPYIRPSTIILLPPAHMLLHGLCKTYLSLSFGKLGPGWKIKDACAQKPFLFSSKAIKQFQADWDCVEYPHGKASRPRDPVKYIQDYKMEEVADLLWIGGIAAIHATTDWRAAWGHLRTACQHYLFGFEASEAECRQAHARLWCYAESCENAVKTGEVPFTPQHGVCVADTAIPTNSTNIWHDPTYGTLRWLWHASVQAPESLLTPNLHAAVCGLWRQERDRGPAALESEWWMERFFLEPKCLVAGVGRVRPEVSYINACIIPDRQLRPHKARFPRVEVEEKRIFRGVNADPNQSAGYFPFLQGAPIPYTPLVARRCRNNRSSRNLVPLDNVVGWCVEQVLRSLAFCPDAQFDAWRAVDTAAAEDKDSILACARVVVFHRCQLGTMLLSSELSSKVLAREGKSEASSYCLVRTSHEETGHTDLEPCRVRYFIMMAWKVPDTISRMAVVCPIAFSTQADECDAFGQTVFRFDPKVDLRQEHDKLVQVSSIVRPLILIKTPRGTARCMWRLVQFQGKLLGSINQSEFW